MQRQQVNSFLSRIFRDGSQAIGGYLTLGFIPVDMKTGVRKKMIPESFEWPRQKKQVLAWIEDKSTRGEVYYCPALRQDESRKKGNAVDGGLQWLWADVDMEKVPADRIEGVKRAIGLLSTLTVKSGTGDNCHVYVKLEGGEVTAENHEYLNTLLRDLLCADNKQADNSLLRVAGTYNYKGVGKSKSGADESRSGVRDVVYEENRKGGGRRGKSLGVDVVSSWLEKHWDKIAAGNKKGEDLNGLRTRLARGGGYDDRGKEGVDWIRSDDARVRAVLRGSIRQMVSTTSQSVKDGEFKGRRYMAVQAVAEKLYMRLDGDRNLVHTLMDDFEPGRDKEAEERSYSLHRDLERVLDALDAGLEVEETGELSESARKRVEAKKAKKERLRQAREAAAARRGEGGESDWEGGSNEGDELGGGGDDESDEDYWHPDPERLERQEARKYWGIKTGEAARRRVRAEEAAETMPSLDDVIDDSTGEVLKAGTFETFEEMERKGIQDQQFAIEGLCGVGHSVTITAQYKTGKTTFALNLAKALVSDNEERGAGSSDGGRRGDFLGNVRLLKDGSKKLGSDGTGWHVAVWSCEMDRDNLGRDLMKMDLRGVEKSRLGVWNLRGSRVDIMSDEGMELAIKSLTRGRKEGGEDSGRENGGEGGVPARAWIIDSLARLCAMSGVEENDNSGVMQLLRRVDEIKRKAGVSECYVLVHTGRGEMESGKERARGATAVDDWADVRWILTKDDMGHRYLRADGRGVSLDETLLEFDSGSLAYTLGSGDRLAAAENDLQALVMECVKVHAGVTGKRLRMLLRRESGWRGKDAEIVEALEELVEARMVKARKGSRGAKCYYAVGESTADQRSRARATVRDSQKALASSPVRPRSQRSRGGSARDSAVGESSRKRAIDRGARDAERTAFDPDRYHDAMSDRPIRTTRATPRLLDVWKATEPQE